MFTQLVVPVDLSPASFEAVPVAARLVASAAEHGVDAGVTVLTVVDRLADVGRAQDILEWAVRRMGRLGGVVPELVVDADRRPARAIVRRLEQQPGAMALMRSHGHGRSAAVLGSTTDELLRTMFGPVIVIGPNATSADSISGNYLLPLDASGRSLVALPVAAAWANQFHGHPHILGVIDGEEDAGEADYRTSIAAIAHQLERRIGGDSQVVVDIVEDRRVSRAIADAADRNSASLIFLSTHGRTGLERLRIGSVAADVVRRATCPVVMFRPPASANGGADPVLPGEQVQVGVGIGGAAHQRPR